MRIVLVRHWVVPVVLASVLAGCASNAVQPGIVHSSSGTSASAPTYGAATAGEAGRVVSINEVALRGAGGGSGNGALIGGALGAAGGGVLGGVTGKTAGATLIGALLGAVGGAIAGSIADGHRGGGRGIEVTVQKDDGKQVTVAQRDDGDVQLGDRVHIVQDNRGVARVVRDTARKSD